MTELESIAARGRAMVAFCERVRERGGIAVVEEQLDLPVLRALYLLARAGARTRSVRGDAVSR